MPMNPAAANNKETIRLYRIAHGSDGNLRVALNAGQAEWGDHVRVEFMHESKPGLWYYTHLDADSADALGDELKKMAAFVRGR